MAVPPPLEFLRDSRRGSKATPQPQPSPAPAIPPTGSRVWRVQGALASPRAPVGFAARPLHFAPPRFLLAWAGWGPLPTPPDSRPPPVPRRYPGAGRTHERILY